MLPNHSMEYKKRQHMQCVGIVSMQAHHADMILPLLKPNAADPTVCAACVTSGVNCQYNTARLLAAYLQQSG